MTQFEAQLASLRAQERTARAKFEDCEQDVTALTEEMGFAVAAAEKRVSSTKAKLQSRQIQIAVHRAKVNQTSLDYQRQKLLLKQGFRQPIEVEKSKNESDIAIAEYKSVRLFASSLEHELVAKQNELEKTKSIGQNKLDKAIAKQKNAQGQIAVARKEIGKLLIGQQELKRLLIIAPQDGIVHRLYVHSRGDVAKKGDPLLTVVPEAKQKAVELLSDGTGKPLTPNEDSGSE